MTGILLHAALHVALAGAPRGGKAAKVDDEAACRTSDRRIETYLQKRARAQGGRELTCARKWARGVDVDGDGKEDTLLLFTLARRNGGSPRSYHLVLFASKERFKPVAVDLGRDSALVATELRLDGDEVSVWIRDPVTKTAPGPAVPPRRIVFRILRGRLVRMS